MKRDVIGQELANDVHGMTKRFGSRTVVDNIGLQIRRGEIYGFLGPNGSGKTTFIRMLCGLLRPDSPELARAGPAERRERRTAEMRTPARRNS